MGYFLPVTSYLDKNETNEIPLNDMEVLLNDIMCDCRVAEDLVL